jgi:DNA topoisomerase-1
MVIRFSRRGPFLGCSGYPKCRNAKPLPEHLKQQAAPEPSGETCELCGQPMMVRRSRRGPFLGCSGYPKCRNTKPLKPASSQDESN